MNNLNNYYLAVFICVVVREMIFVSLKMKEVNKVSTFDKYLEQFRLEEVICA